MTGNNQNGSSRTRAAGGNPENTPENTPENAPEDGPGQGAAGPRHGPAPFPDTRSGNDPDFDPVALAEKNFTRVLRALDALADELHGREDSAVARAARLAGEARGAIQTIFNERQRIAKLDDANTGALGAELDLDAARAEVGRRLALLRERGGPERLPGGAG